LLNKIGVSGFVSAHPFYLVESPIK